MDLGFSVSGLIVVELRILGGGGEMNPLCNQIPTLQPQTLFSVFCRLLGRI